MSFASNSKGSVTVIVEDDTVVVVPFTVRLPVIVTLSGSPTVIVLFETEVLTSFAVPIILRVSVPIVTLSFPPLSARVLKTSHEVALTKKTPP